MSLVLPGGSVLELIGQFYEKNNDASISSSVLDTCTDLSVLCQDNDIYIVDRGFRDVVEDFKALGHDAKMPSLLSKKHARPSAIDANESCMITKCRWVVESFMLALRSVGCFLNESSNHFYLLLGR